MVGDCVELDTVDDRGIVSEEPGTVDDRGAVSEIPVVTVTDELPTEDDERE